MKKINGIFPILLYEDKVQENDIIKTRILSTIESEVQKSPYRIPMGWETKNLYTTYKEPNEFLKKIFKDYYLKYIQNFFNTKFKIECKDIWFNYYKDSSCYQESHHHLNQDSSRNFSGVHFLSYDPENHSPLVFHDPLRLVRASTINEYYDQKISLNPEEGSIFLFPSYLEHSVPQSTNQYKIPRITISFNLRVTD